MNTPPSSGLHPASGMPLPERQAVKGRGTVWAIEHRFSQQSSEPCDDGWGLLD